MGEVANQLYNTFIILAIREGLKTDENNYKPGPNEYRISGVPACSRQMYYWKVCPEQAKENTEDSVLRMAIGTAIHNIVGLKMPKNVLIESEKKLEYKLPFDEEIKLVGHLDLKVWTDATQTKKKITDMKTSNPWMFKHKEEDGPTIQHRFQANTYACIEGVERYSILYINIGNFDMIEFEYDTDYDMFLVTVTKVKYVHDCVKLKKPPVCDPESWECKYCPFPHVCDYPNKKGDK